VSEPLVHFHAGKTAKGFVSTLVDAAENCLFVALEGKPFIGLDPAEAGELKLTDLLAWRGRKNAYSGYDSLRFDQENWRMLAMEMEPHYVKVQFGPRPAQLSKALPEQFRPMTDPPGELLPGALLDAERLPRLGNAEPA